MVNDVHGVQDHVENEMLHLKVSNLFKSAASSLERGAPQWRYVQTAAEW